MAAAWLGRGWHSWTCICWPPTGKWGVHFGRVNCPRCGKEQPARRWPTSFRQAAWGGWTCRRCGCEMDKYGKRLEEGE